MTTATTVYYTDSTPPATFTGTMNTGLKGLTDTKPDRIKYALYDDATTWAAWLSWAQQNAYDNNALKNFSSRAL